MTSLACVPVGRGMPSCVALPAVPLLALAEPSKPMITAPGQVSATSHSFAAARHTVPALPAACWQLELVPSHVSVVQGLPSSAHAAPALPAGCWQVALVPLHWSRVQGLPSSVQAAFALAKVQFILQQEPFPFAVPRSHCSGDSTTPLPQMFVGGASVNVVSAVRPEGSPVAVSVNATPRSKTSTMKSAFMKSPFASATAVSWRGGSTAGSSYRTKLTVSPGSQPEPVMVTVWPGA